MRLEVGMEKQLISIIVPVYNAEMYLKKCLDSIVKQTYLKLQIICVDDASTDNSWDILLEYASKDERFCIYQKANEGVSKARNYGLKKAIGEYLMFVDSDDWLDERTCELAIEKIQSTRSDVIMWSYVRELSGKSRPKSIMEYSRTYDEVEIREKLYRRMYGIIGEELAVPENADALCTVWGKLYRRNIIEENQINFFDVRKIGNYEDGLFNMDVFCKAKQVFFLNENLYHYRRDNSNSVTSEYNGEIRSKKNILFDYLQQRINEENLGMEYVQALNNRIVLSLIELGINEMNSSGSYVDKITQINAIIVEDRYRAAIENFESMYLPIHWKIFFGLAKKRCAVGVYGLLWMIQKIRKR